MELNPRTEVKLYNEKSMWRRSTGRKLVVSTIAPLGNLMFNFYVKHTVYGASLILLGKWFGITVRF